MTRISRERRKALRVAAQQMVPPDRVEPVARAVEAASRAIEAGDELSVLATLLAGVAEADRCARSHAVALRLVPGLSSVA